MENNSGKTPIDSAIFKTATIYETDKLAYLLDTFPYETGKALGKNWKKHNAACHDKIKMLPIK